MIAGRRVGRGRRDGAQLDSRRANGLAQLEKQIRHVRRHRHRLRQLVEVGGPDLRLLRLRHRVDDVRRRRARLLHLNLGCLRRPGDRLRRRALRRDEHEPAEDEQHQVAADDHDDRSPARDLLASHELLPVVVSAGAGGITAGAGGAGAPLIAALMLNCTPPPPLPVEPGGGSRAGARERHGVEIGDEREAGKQPCDAVVRVRSPGDDEALRRRRRRDTGDGDGGEWRRHRHGRKRDVIRDDE